MNIHAKINFPMLSSSRIALNLLIASVFFLLSSQFTNAQQSYSSMRALLIVGHQEDGTSSAINDMNKIAAVFEQHGIQVYKFYDSRASWNDIKSVAPNCNFLVYSGHGSTMGENGESGGLCINQMVSTAEMLSELRLKTNSMVLFKSVCRGAGSSAGDLGDIGISEAIKRVTSYSNPFFKIGAMAYYANNYGGGVEGFLKNFLAKESLSNCFTQSAELWTDIECDKSFTKDATKRIGIASSAGGGTSTVTTYHNGVKTVKEVENAKSYDIAYVGAAGFSITAMLSSK
jgi:hypothetical protein